MNLISNKSVTYQNGGLFQIVNNQNTKVGFIQNIGILSQTSKDPWGQRFVPVEMEVEFKWMEGEAELNGVAVKEIVNLPGLIFMM